MWEPSEREAEDCLEHGKSCSFGICSECVIGITGGNSRCNREELGDVTEEELPVG